MFDQLLSWIATHSKHLPEGMIQRAFLMGADFTWLIHTGGVRQLERNLAHVQGVDYNDSSRTHKQVRRLSRQAMRSYFLYFSDAMTVGARSHEQLRARIRACGSGVEALRKHIDNGASAAVALGHQGNWDYAGFWAHDDLHAQVLTVAENLSNEELLNTFIDIRKTLGIDVLLTGTPHITAQLEERLHDNSIIEPLLADRDLGRNGEFVYAFDSVIRVARGPATLAYDTDVPLFVANMYQEPLRGDKRMKAHNSYGYVLEINGPIDISPFCALEREEAIAKISQAWVQVWQQGIQKHACDWHMMQPIFIEDLDMERLHSVPQWVLKKVSQQ